MPLRNIKQQCKAIGKINAARCMNPAVKGYAVCRMHGANPKRHGGAPRKNLNAAVHGAFVTRFLNNGEEEIFNQFMDGLKRDIPDMNESADYALAVTAGMVFIRLQRAIEGNAQPE